MSRPVPAVLHLGIVTSRFVATCEFYFRHFQLAPVEITSDYALLGREDGARLAILRAGGEGQPAALVQGTRGTGVWLAFETDDVEALHRELSATGAEIVVDPEFTISGQQRCVVRDPNGVLIYITSRADRPEPVSCAQTPDSNHEDNIDSLRRVPRE